MAVGSIGSAQLQAVIDKANQGIVIVDEQMCVGFWNHFMEVRSGRAASQVVGRDIFSCFPELPAAWLTKKLRSVLLLGNYAFTSWRERPYLFRLAHDRPITGSIDFMRQDCTMFVVPAEAGGPKLVCIAVLDVTDLAIAELRLREALGEVEKLSEHDPLTGLYNRRRLEWFLAMEIARSKRYGTPFSVLMCDLDHFKAINDTHGHEAGDTVLRTVASHFTASMRSSDICARYGGEEFVIIVPSTGEEGAASLAERLRKSVAANAVALADGAIMVTMSIGVASFAPEDRDGVAVLGRADKAMYSAKESGRNRVVRFSQIHT